MCARQIRCVLQQNFFAALYHENNVTNCAQRVKGGNSLTSLGARKIVQVSVKVAADRGLLVLLNATPVHVHDAKSLVLLSFFRQSLRHLAAFDGSQNVREIDPITPSQRNSGIPGIPLITTSTIDHSLIEVDLHHILSTSLPAHLAQNASLGFYRPRRVPFGAFSFVGRTHERLAELRKYRSSSPSERRAS